MKTTLQSILLFAGVGLISAVGATEPVRPVKAPYDKIVKASRNIDQLIEQRLKKEGTRFNPPIGDEAFLRRIYLTAAGRIPTLDEQNAFLQSKSQNKRGQLIDHLLNSEAYVHTQYVFFADLLRVKERFEGLPNAGGLKPGNQYAQWIKDALRANMPFNRMAYELVNARGGLWKKIMGRRRTTSGIMGCHSITCRIPLRSSWEPRCNARSAMTTLSTNGRRWTFIIWRPLLTA